MFLIFLSEVAMILASDLGRTSVRSVNSAFEGKNLLRYFVFYMEFNSEKRNYVCLSVFK